MSDYWDYLRDSWAHASNPWAMYQSWYNRAYDDSHGSGRYWLSKVPIFSTVRKWSDESKEAQDRYDNTHTDEAYINRVIGFSGADFNHALSSGVGRVARMARSLSDVYTPEVVENVGKAFNNSYM